MVLGERALHLFGGGFRFFYAEFSVFTLNSEQWFDEFWREIILVGVRAFQDGR